MSNNRTIVHPAAGLLFAASPAVPGGQSDTEADALAIFLHTPDLLLKTVLISGLGGANTILRTSKTLSAILGGIKTSHAFMREYFPHDLRYWRLDGNNLDDCFTCRRLLKSLLAVEAKKGDGQSPKETKPFALSDYTCKVEMEDFGGESFGPFFVDSPTFVNGRLRLLTLDGVEGAWLKKSLLHYKRLWMGEWYGRDQGSVTVVITDNATMKMYVLGNYSNATPKRLEPGDDLRYQSMFEGMRIREAQSILNHTSQGYEFTERHLKRWTLGLSRANLGSDVVGCRWVEANIVMGVAGESIEVCVEFNYWDEDVVEPRRITDATQILMILRDLEWE